MIPTRMTTFSTGDYERDIATLAAGWLKAARQAPGVDSYFYDSDHKADVVSGCLDRAWADAWFSRASLR